VKEAGTIVAAVLLEAGVLLGSLVVGVNVAGGLSPSHSSLDDVPVVGAMLPVRSEKKQQTGAEQDSTGPAPQSKADSVSSMEFATEGTMESLVQELEFEKQECDALRKRLERKSREIKAREKQLATDRKALLQDFQAKKRTLAKLKKEIEDKRAELEETRIIMRARELENLKDTSKIYERMDAEEAAKILSETYKKKPETVVKLLSLMRDRCAGEIMAEFADPVVCGEITEKLSHVEEPTEKEG